MSRRRKKELEPGVCPNCGTRNPEDAKFCNECGATLRIIMKEGFEGLVSLHTVAALYVLLSAVFNPFVNEDPIFLGLYLVPGVLGLGVAYALNAGKIRRWIKLLSFAMIIVGFLGTTLLFLIGLAAGYGIFGPGWVIFLVTAWKLWQDRHRL